MTEIYGDLIWHANFFHANIHDVSSRTELIHWFEVYDLTISSLTSGSSRRSFIQLAWNLEPRESKQNMYLYDTEIDFAEGHPYIVGYDNTGQRWQIRCEQSMKYEKGKKISVD